MSGSASESAESAAERAATSGEGGGATFVESDAAETLMTYNERSKVPVVVMCIWAVAMISFVAYMVVYALPDLRLWLRS